MFDLVGVAASARPKGNPAYTFLILIVIIGVIVLIVRSRSRARRQRDAAWTPTAGISDVPQQQDHVPGILVPPPLQVAAVTSPSRAVRGVDPTPGSTIAGYRVIEQVGHGGMAVVFRAQDEGLGRQVALKVLAPNLSDDEAFRQRFIRESRAAAALDDPHIIPVFQAGQAEGVLFIAMRYVSGSDVRTVLDREGQMAIARTAAIISPVASALDTAHAAGLVHRDVKPANILIDVRPRRPDHVYLSDFGLAKNTATVASLTGTGNFLGTLDYISPEQIEGKPVGGATDQYALACTAFELLTGTPPFRKSDAAAIMYAQLSEPPPRLTDRRPDLPPGLNGVVAKALAKSPTNRFVTCTDFADELRAAAGLPAYQPDGSSAAAPHPPTQVV